MLAKLAKLPKIVIFLTLLLVAIGIAVLYSAADGNFSPWASKQLLLFVLSCPLVLVIAFLNVRTIYQFSYPAYFLALAFLLGVEILGHTAMGATRWLEIGGIKLQPSEPAKFAIILMLAKYFNDCSPGQIKQWGVLLIPALATAVLCGLIIKQPDLGTGLLTLISAAMIFFVIGVDLQKILIVLTSCISLLPIAWHFLYDYQKKRIDIFLNPENDPLGSGYNIIQSKIAIGSGGLTGKGFLQGSQSHLSFLPEHQTDFIFAFLTEEFGFIGGMIMIFLFTLLIGAIINISISCKSVFLKIIAQGVASIIFCHVFINISMVMGVLPAVGIPLPFISYGGTMIVSMMVGIGLVFNAHLNRNFRI
jgi:rod shape determining protein RodA